MSKPAARIRDAVAHPHPPVLTGGSGSPNVFIGSLPAWRGQMDVHRCTTTQDSGQSHGSGVVIDGSKTVLINNYPASRQGDTIREADGSVNKITGGLSSVLIGG